MTKLPSNDVTLPHLPHDLHDRLQTMARAHGFAQVGVTGVDLSAAEPGLLAWLAAGFHGQMDYMQRHGLRRARPAALVEGTLSVITARMDYLPAQTPADWAVREAALLTEPGQAVVSLYARGRDYHKVLRQRLQRLADDLQAWLGPMGHRVFCDSAPVLEVELAQQSGLVWRGKHTLGLHREGGSMFFLGEIYVDVALPPTTAVAEHCGRCSACIDVCPTGAIVAPYRLDARRCISYLTIEHDGPIDEALRPLIGNHVYGCDDCQLACPWNKYAQRSDLPDFAPKAHFDPARHPASGEALLLWLAWSEAEFLAHTEGSPVRRIGHQRWLRNTALVAGNALADVRVSAPLRQRLRAALQAWSAHPSDTVREQVAWSLGQGPVKTAAAAAPTPPAPVAG